MTVKLFFEALFKYIIGLAMMILLIFLPAGTFNYWNGWLLIGLLFIPILIAGGAMMIYNPELLKRRLENKEREKVQVIVILISIAMFISGFLVAGFDHKYGWSNVDIPTIVIASILFLSSYLIYGEVLTENAFLSRTIVVLPKQKVIDTGLYSVVRHPMYSATVILFLAMPLILGSWVSFAIFLIYPLIIIIRINNEEKVLTEQLSGYKEYKEKVKYKLIPFVW